MEWCLPGSWGSASCSICHFNLQYTGVSGKRQRNCQLFASNEDLYNRLSIGAVSYDLIIPSDYMVARMREEGMLLPLYFDNIPNYECISEDFRGLYYDPQKEYSIPCAYGMMGVIHDADVVDEAHVGGWELLWNEAYADKILQYNNSRDAFSTGKDL